MNKKSIVILGISRCGSSLMLEILKKGFGIPIATGKYEAGSPAGGYNEYWELNNFFKSVLGSWSKPSPEKQYEERVKNSEEVLNLLLKRKEEIIAFKALEFSICPNLLKRIPNPRMIIMFREPNSSAESMLKQARSWRMAGRDRKDVIKLWSIFYFRILRFLSRNEIPYILVNFDDLIDDPEGVVEKLSKFLDLKVRNLPDGIIKRELRHFKVKE